MPIKSSYQRCSVRKGVLRNFAKLTGKYLCKSFFFNKVAGLRHFPVIFSKSLRTPFSQNTSERLPLAYDAFCKCLFWQKMNLWVNHACQHTQFNVMIQVEKGLWFWGNRDNSWTNIEPDLKKPYIAFNSITSLGA